MESLASEIQSKASNKQRAAFNSRFALSCVKSCLSTFIFNSSFAAISEIACCGDNEVLKG